ncbi:hypothetical protein NP493_134g02021 [Ridgeia piscesae]|uniref:Uncharacterized protein n=1 Tax=Ridgeia piscesae TaxID=27915 RepID=A0AAD9P5J2_RIDPI|nr:hypothetical protein NP493_134g02021 [Ridgeia piscesae]
MTIHIRCHGNWRHLASGTFSYTSNKEHQLACYLLKSVHHPLRLEDLQAMKEVTGVDVTSSDVVSLDWTLTKSLAHLDIPEDWNMLGSHSAGMGLSGSHFTGMDLLGLTLQVWVS